MFFIIGKVSSFEEEDGTGTGRNEVRIKLSRGDLGSQFTCQAENEAIDQPLSTSVQVDVNRKSLYYIFSYPLDGQIETSLTIFYEKYMVLLKNDICTVY